MRGKNTVTLREYKTLVSKKKRSKFGNRWVTHSDGTRFGSTLEMNRYSTLLFLIKIGEIQDLTLQPKFVLQKSFMYKGVTVPEITYKADFQYLHIARQITIVEDVKSVATACDKVFVIKSGLLMKKLNLTDDIEFFINVIQKK